MKHLFLIINFLCFCTCYSQKEQLLMFVHTHPSVFTDDEGLHVAHQMLTALVQQAAPILMSENVWQHVVLRSERFTKALQDTQSLQQDIVDLYKKTNQTILHENGDCHKVTTLLDNAWYQQHYPRLAKVDADVIKQLHFDFFCYYAFDYIKNYVVYHLLEGYVLCIPNNQSDNFNLHQAKKMTYSQVKKPTFKKHSFALHQVLTKYLKKSKNCSWCFYLTGHGYHKDADHPEPMVAGMTLHAFSKLLHALNNKTFHTSLLTYSSCYAAGEHSIIPYQQIIQGNQQNLHLDYPVIMMSLADSPTYVFGLPSGFKLPPYNQNMTLQNSDIDNKQLQFYFLQNFKKFCDITRLKQSAIELARALNPYVQCFSEVCNVTRIENIPLLRKKHSSYFVPLDTSVVQSLLQDSPQDVTVNSKKSALLWYVKHHNGTIMLSHTLPMFISMLPGRQVHRAFMLQASASNFETLIREVFLAIDDMKDESIYLFDKLSCQVTIPQISSDTITMLDNVVVLPAGTWLPSFAQLGASCYVYAEHNRQGYWIIFNQHKQLHDVIPLSGKQQDIFNIFKALLLQESRFGSRLSLSKLMSSEYFNQRKSLEQKLLTHCLQQHICKE
ncbi:MAG: hypothetical protein CL947_01980 [Epsilonproteobacteria bacterium]|nr:hypothetical protein [Campylobacterota bacterium]